MNRKIVNYFDGVIVIKIEGRKIERFLSYLYRLKIDVLDVRCIDRSTAIIKIYNSDLDKVQSLKTSYEIDITGYEGKLRLKEKFRQHFFLVLSILIGFSFLFLLSHVIFDVEVIHSNASIRNLITDELADHDIKRWHMKKNFNQITKIKEEILNKYKNRIEWLEIESIGTKYIVKVEERKIIVPEENYIYQDIVASKNAVILKIEAAQGEIIRRKNDYVKAGDVIISGKIMKGEEVSKLIKADGKIYGEVWYNIKVEHPLHYQSKKETGKKKNVFKIVFLRHSISLFNFKPFKSQISSTSDIVFNPLIPFRIVKEQQKEVTLQDEIYTDGEALIMAEAEANDKMKGYLADDEHIISSRKLKYYIDNQTLYLEMFFKVYENIGKPRAIME